MAHRVTEEDETPWLGSCTDCSLPESWICSRALKRSLIHYKQQSFSLFLKIHFGRKFSEMYCILHIWCLPQQSTWNLSWCFCLPHGVTVRNIQVCSAGGGMPLACLPLQETAWLSYFADSCIPPTPIARSGRCYLCLQFFSPSNLCVQEQESNLSRDRSATPTIEWVLILGTVAGLRMNVSSLGDG